MNQSYDQELEHLDVQISVDVASKHVVLQYVWEHAVISYVGITPFGMIMIGTNKVRRMGVG